MMMSREAANPWDMMAGCSIYDLAQPLEAKMPVSPNHPGFKMALMRRHGDMERTDGGSAANEMMLLGGHTGTHIDALCHVSHRGKLFGDVDASEAQRGGSFSSHGVETIAPILCRGVLLDVAALKGVDVLDPAEPISAADLEATVDRQKVEVGAGDAVLIRSGWPSLWQDSARFLGATDGAPGPDESAARWLSERQIRLSGAETVAFEWIPPGRGHALLPVHRILLVESGIFIVEMMDLTELARDNVWEFLFILTPLKVAGATGVPVRPIAVAQGEPV
jgi:kynurenine formamidase